VYLIRGSPNRGIVVVRDLGRYYSVSIDSIENYARVYVLKDHSRIDEFRSKAYHDFIVNGVFFPSKEFEVRYENYELRVHTGPAYSRVEIKPPEIKIWPVEQRRPVEVSKGSEIIRFSIPTFAVPFALFDVMERSEKDLLAKLVRNVYGF